MRAWDVLLIGGISGVGKSTAAAQIGLKYGIPWVGIDDLRLAFQRARVTLPSDTDALYFFDETPTVWQRSPTELRDALIRVGEVMSPAIEVVIENHIDQSLPAVIEGDGILPAMIARSPVRQRNVDGRIRIVIVVEADETALLRTITARGRTSAAESIVLLRTEARAKWLFGRWLEGEATRYGIEVVASRPMATLAERILASVSRPSQSTDEA